MFSETNRTAIVKGLFMLLLKTHVFKKLYFQEIKILCALCGSNFNFKSCLRQKRVKHYLMLLYQNCVRNPNRFRTIISKAPLQISYTKSAGNFIDCICSWTSYQWVINQGDYIIVTFLTHKIKLDNFILVSQYLLSFKKKKSYLSSSTLSFQFILTYLFSLPPICLLNPIFLFEVVLFTPSVLWGYQKSGLFPLILVLS